MGKLACPIDVVFLKPVEAHSLLDAHPLSLTDAPTTDPHELGRPFSFQLLERIEGGWDVAVVPGAETRHQKPLRFAQQLPSQASPVCLVDRGQRYIAADRNHLNVLANTYPFQTPLPLIGSHAERVAPRSQKPYRGPLPESPGVPLQGMMEGDVQLMEVCDHAHPAADPDQSRQQVDRERDSASIKGVGCVLNEQYLRTKVPEMPDDMG